MPKMRILLGYERSGDLMHGAYFPTVLEDSEDIGVRIEIRRGGGTCEVAEVTPAPRIR